MGFKISKKTYDSSILKAGRFVKEPIYTQYDVFDTHTGVIFFRFQESHKKYITDLQIQCAPEWEPVKELLPDILVNLKEDQIYEYGLINQVKREFKLSELLR